MYELLQVSEHDFYIDCPAKMGLSLVGDKEAVLIDSGNDKDAGKKALKILNEKGWTLKAVYNTHSHADHIGGNKLIQERTGCRIFAPGLENVFTNSPILEPMNLYGGFPFKELKNKFLMAAESKSEPLTPEVLEDGMEIIELPGHSFDMVGFMTKDGTVYLADCVSSEETLTKYGIGYLWDVQSYLETLEKVKGLQAEIFIPAHAPATREIAPLAQINIDAALKTAEKIVGFCESPICFEDLLKKLFDDYGLVMSAQQYVLIGSTVRSYLAWLKEQGKVTFEFEESRMLWMKVQS